MYDFLSLTNTIHLTADIILWSTNVVLQIDDFRIFFHRKKYNPSLTVPPSFHLNSCTATKSNLYLANSLAAVIREPDQAGS